MNDWYDGEETVTAPRTLQSKINANSAAILIFFGFTASTTIYELMDHNHFNGPILDLIMDSVYLIMAFSIMASAYWVSSSGLKISGAGYVLYNIAELVLEFVFADKIINEIVLESSSVKGNATADKSSIKVHYYLSVFFHLLFTLIPLVLMYNLCKLDAKRVHVRNNSVKEDTV